MDSSEIDRTGVSICQETVSRMNIIFREQTVKDYGIDAIIEPKTESYASGQLIGLQIKTGDSYFDESNESSFIYRGEMKHYHYWLNHCLPVLIVLVDINTRLCYWQRVEKHLITITEKGWKIEIPKNNVLNRSEDAILDILTSQSEYEKRFNTLLFSLDWIRAAKKNGLLILEVNEWINKSSGRGDFKLMIPTPNGEEELSEQTYLGFGLRDYSLVIKDMFPWANISIDEDYYDYNMDDEWRCKYEESNSRFEMSLLQEGRSIPERDNTIFPYENCAGEVDKYRLILTLNEIGEAFLVLEDFLSEGECYFLS